MRGNVIVCAVKDVLCCTYVSVNADRGFVWLGTQQSRTGEVKRILGGKF